MVSHPLLSEAAIERGFSILHLLIHKKTVEQILRLTPAHVSFRDDGDVRRPRHGHGGVVNVVKPVRITETVLRQNHMLRPLTQQTNEHAPTLDGHIDAADAIAQALADTSVAPLDLDEVARG